MTGRVFQSGDSTSLSLLTRVRQNDNHAWDRFVELYSPLVGRWCSKMGLGPPHADDVKQEVFIAVAKHLSDFVRGDRKGSFRAWLKTVTWSKVADYWRARKAEILPIGGSEAFTQFATLAQATNGESDADGIEEKSILYRRAVELIKKDFEVATWTAFWRTVIDGLSAGEVADEIGISRNAVHLAKARVFRRLRQEFVDLIE